MTEFDLPPPPPESAAPTTPDLQRAPRALNEPPECIEDLTWNWWEDGKLVRQEMAKAVVSNKGAWVTMAYMYRDFERSTGSWKRPRVALVRYRRRGGRLKRHGAPFHLNADQLYSVNFLTNTWLHVGDPSADMRESGIELVPPVPPIDPEELSLKVPFEPRQAAGEK